MEGAGLAGQSRQGHTLGLEKCKGIMWGRVRCAGLVGHRPDGPMRIGLIWLMLCHLMDACNQGAVSRDAVSWVKTNGLWIANLR